MAFRTVCICEGKQIGIESIYTYLNGKQINIPGKVENLRKLGRERKLFCPCDCGNNLILVAGDRNLREQHFRLLNTPGAKECTAIDEGMTSIQSKTALSYWFHSKLQSKEIEGRVSLDRVYATNRKFEYTFYDFENQIGLCYWHNRANIESEKLDLIDMLSEHSQNIYITDIKNTGNNGQYPEFMNKIQEKQGYVLYLDLGNGETYESVSLDCRVLHQTMRGDWVELPIISDRLDTYEILPSGSICYQGKSLSALADTAITAYQKEQQIKKKYEDQQQRIHQQKLKELAEERERAEQEKRAREKETNAAYEKEIEKIKDSDQIKNRYVVVDSRGKKWYCCKYCGKVARAQDMHQYGVRNGKNLSVCRGCEEKHNADIKKKLGFL